MASVLPPLDGSLPNLVDYVDFNAKYNGEKPWLLFPSSNAPSSRLASLAFADLSSASHKAAHIFRPNREGHDNRIVAVILNTDTVLYAAAMLGLMRAGFVPYPMSPRNSPQGISHMLRATSCTRVLAHSLTMPLVEQAQAELRADGIALKIDDLPSMRQLFPRLADPNREPEETLPYPPPPKPAVLDDLGMMIHSSGSTGFPKSIPLYHRRILQWMRHNVFGSPRGATVRFAGMGLPTFHAMGFLLQVCYPMCTGKPVVVHAPQYPLPPTVAHPQNILEVARMAQCTALVVLPSFLEAWSHSQEAIDYLKTTEVVVYSGGPLSAVVGNKMIAAGVPIFSAYGGTETGNPSQQWTKIPRSERVANTDWEWLRISEIASVKWEPQGDGSYELIVCENKDYTLGAYNVPGQKAFATSDLFVPHPTKEGLWRIVGRTDDVITLSTGEKIVPLPQEGTVGASSLVAGCVMFGREHEQAGILIEPVQELAVSPGDDTALAAFRNRIWPTIEQANVAAPAFARIFKEMILVADASRPLPRSAKGAVVRKMSLIQYAVDITRLYETIEESSNAKGIDPPTSWSLEDVLPWLLAHAKSLIDKEDICPTNDLFSQGFDSLSATFFRNRIVGALRSSTKDAQTAATSISSNLIFEHSNVQRLALAISSLVQAEDSAPISSTGVPVSDIQALVNKLTAGIAAAKADRTGNTTPPVVLLTGATGNIGSHILAQLLADERIDRVYALNRPSADLDEKLKSAFKLRRIPIDLLRKEKFVSLAGDVTQPDFGLQNQQYDEIMNSVTHIIHNAWSVNFNLPLRAFEDQLAGVRKLVDLCAAADHTIRLLVTSSIGVANNWPSANASVPESPLSDPSPATSSGYTASKYVVEQILDAAFKGGIPATTVRMGQACGPRGTGAWGTAEWLPMMLKSSVALGCLPNMTGPVSWIPLDTIGYIYSDWITSSGDLPSLVNVVHPRATTWDVVFRGVSEELGTNLPVVSLDQWVAKLDDIAARASEKDLVDIPALNLLDFFRHLTSSSATSADVHGATFDTTRLTESAPTARELQPLSEEDGRMWVRYWRQIGYLSA